MDLAEVNQMFFEGAFNKKLLDFSNSNNEGKH